MNPFRMTTSHLPIRERSVVAIDCETTGLHVENGDRIVELAMVKQHPDGRTEEWSSLLNPECEMSSQQCCDSRNHQCYGLRSTSIFSSVWSTIKNWIDDSIIVAHNAPFDLGSYSPIPKIDQPSLNNADVLDTLIRQKILWFSQK